MYNSEGGSNDEFMGGAVIYAILCLVSPQDGRFIAFRSSVTHGVFGGGGGFKRCVPARCLYCTPSVVGSAHYRCVPSQWNRGLGAIIIAAIKLRLTVVPAVKVESLAVEIFFPK